MYYLLFKSFAVAKGNVFISKRSLDNARDWTKIIYNIINIISYKVSLCKSIHEWTMSNEREILPLAGDKEYRY